MSIVEEKRDDLTTVLKIEVAEGDYIEAVEKVLKTHKKKASIPGFRPGMVPMGVINKMYRPSVVADEAYRSATEACSGYIEENKYILVGEVIPSEEQGKLDFENDKEFEFVFEFGIAPEVKIELSDKNKVNRYKIKVDKKLYEGYEANFMRRFGKLEDGEIVKKDEALEVTLDNDERNITEAYVGLISMDDERRKPYIGKKVGDQMDVDVNELYPQPAQRASILKMKEDELDGINPKFRLTITRIRAFVLPQRDQEFFKTAFPDGKINDEKSFEKHVKGQIEGDLEREAEFLYRFETRKMLIERANLTLPEAFLKRWLMLINEERYTQEQIEQDFPEFLDVMNWNLIQRHFVDKYKLEASQQEMIEEAKIVARQQFMQYGMAEVEDQMLQNYAEQMLSNNDEQRKILDKLYEAKVIDAVTPLISVVEREVSAEQFNKEAEKIVR